MESLKKCKYKIFNKESSFLANLNIKNLPALAY